MVRRIFIQQYLNQKIYTDIHCYKVHTFVLCIIRYVSLSEISTYLHIYYLLRLRRFLIFIYVDISLENETHIIIIRYGHSFQIFKYNFE